MYSRTRGQLLRQRLETTTSNAALNTRPLSVSYVSCDSLRPNPRNARKHSKMQIRQIETSIKEHDFVFPIIVDRERTIIAGHARYIAAKRLKRDEVPIIQLDHVNEKQALAIGLADNRLCEIGKWDDKLLAEILQELSTAEITFSLEATGFSLPEIDVRLEAAAAPEDLNRAEEIPRPFQGPPVSKLGDMWLIGDRHRVLCGNALEPTSYEILMRGEKAHIVFIDPPYGVRVAEVANFGKTQHAEFCMNSGELSPQERKAFHDDLCLRLAENTVDGAIIYICIDAKHLGEVLSAGEAAFDELKAIITWKKHLAGLGSLYRSRSEFIAVFKSGTQPHTNNILLGKFGRNRDTVWEYPGISLFGRGGEEGNVASIHPTVKPVRLVSDALLDCSNRGDLVLDGCLGSGSTLIAAERTARRCVGLELDPKYCDVIIRRAQAYTGESAVHAVTGKTFHDHAAETNNA